MVWIKKAGFVVFILFASILVLSTPTYASDAEQGFFSKAFMFIKSVFGIETTQSVEQGESIPTIEMPPVNDAQKAVDDETNKKNESIVNENNDEREVFEASNDPDTAPILAPVEYSDVTSLGNTSNVTANFEQIGDRYYNVQSSIFVWFSKILESAKPAYVTNVEIYESESAKYRAYYAERNRQREASYTNESEPAFNVEEICIRPTSENPTRATFCTCGDGFCATYEDERECPEDCGYCPEGTVAIPGECIEFIPNTCMNTVCEEGENETCPWDCNIRMLEEKEEILSEEEEARVKERARERAKAFVESHGGVWVEGNESEEIAEPMPEPSEG